MSDIRKATKVQIAEPYGDPFVEAMRSGSNSGKFLIDVSFKIDGLKYDPSTGMFSMQMEMIEMTDEQWHVIAQQFGLGSIPDYLRDDLCRMVHKHRIIEQLQMNLNVE